MLHQGALCEGLRGLRECGIELSLRLRDVQARRDAGIVALFGEAERTRIGFHRLIEDGAVAVEAAQLNVVLHQLRDQRETRVLEVRAVECSPAPAARSARDARSRGP